MRIFIQQSFCGEHPTVEAVAALKSLLVDEGGLERMRLFWSAQTFQREDIFADSARDREQAGARRAIIHQDGAGATLPEAAAEAGIILRQIVSQNVEKRVYSDLHPQQRPGR